MNAAEAYECGLICNVFEHFKLDEIILKLQKVAELPLKVSLDLFMSC